MLATGGILSVSRSFVALGCLASLVAFLVVGCGGGGSSGPPPPPDFSLSVNPSTLSMTVGTISPPAVITVAGQNGFTGQVSISVTDLPAGATTSPAGPFTVSAFGSQQVVLFIPPAAQTGPLSIQFDATGGSLSHSASLNVTVTLVSGTAVLQDASGQVAAATIEIQGLGAGTFNPDYWQKNTLNWVPDMRMPMLAPQTTGPYQNIYAPWPLEQAGGWRLFYGGWDGQDVPFDQIFSVTTSDFLSFANRDHIIANGDFVNVNNVNVQQLPDGSLQMICSGGSPPGSPGDKPVYFSSPDGVTWNGSTEPYSARLMDIISIQGYALFSSGNFNGANVLLRDNGAWVLYFTDWQNDPHTTYRATANTPPNFQLQGAALKTDHAVNDVKKFTVNGAIWYLMGLHNNAQSLWYSLSIDGVSFGSEQTLFNHLSAQDQYIVALGFVTRGNEILGVLYGASAVETLDQNRIFARWLQKKVVITDSSGVQYFAQSAYGLDRQWFPAPASGFLEGTMVVYAEDGVTPLGSSLVTLTAGKAYRLVLQ
jgi:hypothetical protein